LSQWYQRRNSPSYISEKQYVPLSLDSRGIHGFLLDHSVVTTIDFPGAQATIPDGINKSGQIVGHYIDGGRYRGFLWVNGSFTTLTNHPGTLLESSPNDIDDLGRIVGLYY
jgi:probable HAF family extracellular repeat protein